MSGTTRTFATANPHYYGTEAFDEWERIHNGRVINSVDDKRKTDRDHLKQLIREVLDERN